MSEYIFIAANNALKQLEVGVEKTGSNIIIRERNRLLCIYDDEPNCCTEPFTDLPVIMDVQIGMKFSEIEADLFCYIKEAMVENEVVEIWATWMGETEGIVKETRNVDVLTVSDIRWVFDDKERRHPRGLKVFKWVRGKK